MISSARSDQDIKKIVEWFKSGVITNSKGDKLTEVEVSLKHKHSFMERIWSAESISLEEKEALFEQLKALDKSDWLDNTRKYCESAHPGNKTKMWDFYFQSSEAQDENGIDKWGLRVIQKSFAGFNQVSHRNYTSQFEDKFFEKIDRIIETKGRFVAEAYFYNLRPMIKCDNASIKKFEDHLAKVKASNPDSTFFINILKDSISDLKTKQRGIECSIKYLKENK